MLRFLSNYSVKYLLKNFPEYLCRMQGFYENMKDLREILLCVIASLRETLFQLAAGKHSTKPASVKTSDGQVCEKFFFASLRLCEKLFSNLPQASILRKYTGLILSFCYIR
jgi:hypothetical protein